MGTIPNNCIVVAKFTLTGHDRSVYTLIDYPNEIYCINYRENVVRCLLTRSLRLPSSSLFAILRDTLYLLARVAQCASAVDPEYVRIPLWHRHS